MVTGPLVVADPVREALGDGRPVVALESTIFTHGLPRPRNLEVALAAEESLRAIGRRARDHRRPAGRPHRRPDR